ncbi:MAG: precorrin-4 C(11)-methyltransferase [Candidatus Nanoarchaeia archaeon]
MEGTDIIMAEKKLKKIVIAGCGPGAPDHITPAVHCAVNDAEILCGAKRLLTLFHDFKGTKIVVDADIEALLNTIEKYYKSGKKITVLVTGDPGVCSLARPLVERFGSHNCVVIPGISSIQVAFARLGVEWTGAKIINAHAGIPNVSPSCLINEESIAVIGGNARSKQWLLSAAELFKDTHVLFVCRNLTLVEEEVRKLSIAELQRLTGKEGLDIFIWIRKNAESKGGNKRERKRFPARVWFIGAGPGDPELLTRKAEKLLRQCRCCIWAGSLVNPSILDFLPPGAKRYDSSGMTLDEIINVMKRFCREGIDVIRLHTGEPSIFGAIGEQMARLKKLGIEYEIVPGVSSFQAVASSLKCELTAPELSQAIVLTRPEGRTPVPSVHTIDKIAPLKSTLCLFLAGGMIDEVVEKLIPHYGADCPVAVVYHASWPDEKIIRGTLANISSLVRSTGITRSSLMIVGRVLDGIIAESCLYSSSFTHGYRNRTTGKKKESKR